MDFWIDRGGTFTDVIGRAPDGEEQSAKLLSVSDAYEDAAVEGMRRLLGVAPGAPFPADRVAAIKLGTTVATNALLERKGAKTLLVTTRGFADALVIGDQTRPQLFALDIVKPAAALRRRRRGGRAAGRRRARCCGRWTRRRLARALGPRPARGYESAAIAFLHADLNRDARSDGPAAIARARRPCADRRLSARGLAPARVRPARRDHGGRRLPDAGAAGLCAPAGAN